MGTLGRILEETRGRVHVLAGQARDLERWADERSRGPSLHAGLRSGPVAVIAEIKRRSPSRGVIRTELAAAAQAMAYNAGGAAALSVLTEPAHFGGSGDDLREVRQAVPLPVLKKDFHIDPVQLVEARALGASAVLLIARALPPAELGAMLREGARLGLEALVEVRDEQELSRALDAGASMVGINNRDLETLEMDPGTSQRLLPLVPVGVVAVAESGITVRGDVERAAAAGADAVLVGSAVSAADDPTTAVRDLVGVARRERGG